MFGGVTLKKVGTAAWTGRLAKGCRPATYARRHPEQTVFYRLLQQHLEIYLALARDEDRDAMRSRPTRSRSFAGTWNAASFPGSVPIGPPRVYRRFQSLSEWSDEDSNEIIP